MFAFFPGIPVCARDPERRASDTRRRVVGADQYLSALLGSYAREGTIASTYDFFVHKSAGVKQPIIGAQTRRCLALPIESRQRC